MLRSFRSYLVYGTGLFVVLEIMLFAAVWYWPEFMENIGSIFKLAKFSPILSQQVTAIEEGGVVAYIVGQHFFKGCSAVGVSGAVLFAANTIAGEAHRGTLEIHLARPVSRARLMAERWFGGLVAIALPVLLTSLTIPPMMEAREIEPLMDWSDVVRCSVYMSIFLAPVYAATFAWSAMSSEPLRSSLTALFLAILAFALYFVEMATNYTPFRLVDIRVFMDIVDNDALDWRYAAPMLVSTAVLYFVALRAFRARTP